jgi:hypothetical protein
MSTVRQRMAIKEPKLKQMEITDIAVHRLFAAIFFQPWSDICKFRFNAGQPYLFIRGNVQT